jgi:FeS assembly SUF system protein
MIFSKMKITEQQVIERLKTVFDPEIPADIYELGLVYKIEISDDNYVKILMTLTSPNCPEAEHLPGDARAAVMGIPGVEDVWVDLTFEPPWDQSLMSDEAKLYLGFL